MALPLSLSLISTLFIIHAQYDSYHKLTYPEEMGMVDCQLVFNTRDLYDANAPAFCGAPMPCDCDSHAFNNFLLEETTTDIGFNLTDHSSLDFTIYFGQPYLFYSIQFQWQYRNSPINQATSYVSLYDAGLSAWVPHDYEYLPVYGSGSAVDVNATILDKVVSQLRFHLEWNFDSPTGMVQPSGVALYGETQTQFPTIKPSKSPTKSPTSSSQSPTESPSDVPTSAPTVTPRSGLDSVFLAIRCCNGSSQQQLSVPNNTITDTTLYPCCYPSNNGYFSYSADAFGETYTFTCPSVGANISFSQMPWGVSYATGYYPDIWTACGSDQLVSDYPLLSRFNISSYPVELRGSYPDISTIECLCSMEHPSFVAHNASECIDNPLDDLCTVPSDITGYIGVDSRTFDTGFECDCMYRFDYLIWERTHPSGTDTVTNYTLWYYIPWDIGNYTAYSNEYTEQCIEVHVRICSVNATDPWGVWSASGKIMDVATTHFDPGKKHSLYSIYTGNYSQSLSTESYCYVMVDVCTSEPTGSPTAFPTVLPTALPTVSPITLPTVSPVTSVTHGAESTTQLLGTDKAIPSESRIIGIVVSVLMILATLSWMY